MIGLDTNVLIHAVVVTQKEHERMQQWLSHGRRSLCTTLTNIAETLRLLTHPRVFPRPAGVGPAVQTLIDFVTVWQIQVLEEDPGWWREVAVLAQAVRGLRGDEIFDARIALCLRFHGVQEILTLDADFQKYPFLRVVGL